MPDAWKTIVPEGPDVIDGWSIVGGKIYVNRLKDVKIGNHGLCARWKAGRQDRLRRNRLGLGSSRPDHRSLRLTSALSRSFVPPTIYRLDTVTGKREVFFQPKIPFDSSQYELKQVFFKSKDGTQIPMFIAGKKGLKQDGTERLLMTGYGGFNVSDDALLEPRLRPGGWSRAAGSRCPICAAAASMAKTGTSRECLRRSRTSSTTGLRRPST